MALETPSRPPPFMANAILNFHFDFLNPSLMQEHKLFIPYDRAIWNITSQLATKKLIWSALVHAQRVEIKMKCRDVQISPWKTYVPCVALRPSQTLVTQFVVRVASG